jgi:uncharacterized RDD family membrane protein YckC
MIAPAFAAPAVLLPAFTQGVPWRRVVAWIIDAILIGIVAAALWAVLFVLGILTLGLGFVLMAALPAVPLAYHILFVASSRQATPGQTMMDLVVVQAIGGSLPLARPNLAQAVVFTLGLWVTLAVGVWPFLVVFFTTGHRALHDIVAGVVILRREALTRHAGFANMAAE